MKDKIIKIKFAMAAAPIGLALAGMAAAILVIGSIISLILGTPGESKNKPSFTEGLGNWIQGFGWKTNFTAYNDQADKADQLLLKATDNCRGIDREALQAAITNQTIIDPEYYELDENNNDDGDGETNDTEVDPDTETERPAVTEDDRADVDYKKGKYRLGDLTKINFDKKALLPALVSYEWTSTCKSKDDKPLYAGSNKLGDLIKTIDGFDSLDFSNFYGDFYKSVTTTMSSVPSITFSNDEVVTELIKDTFREGTIVDTECESDEYLGFDFNIYIDIDKYHKYLVNIYIPEYYLNCSDCGFKNYTDDEKHRIAMYQANEIVSRSKTYNTPVGTCDSDEGFAGTGPLAPGTVNGSCGSVFNYGQDYDNHTGLDFWGLGNEYIYPLYPGEVVRVGTGCTRYVNCFTGYGNYLIASIEGTDMFQLYAHFETDPFYKVGDIISDIRKPIGKEGSTGNSTGPHSHLEIRKPPGTSGPHLSLKQSGGAPGRVDTLKFIGYSLEEIASRLYCGVTIDENSSGGDSSGVTTSEPN